MEDGQFAVRSQLNVDLRVIRAAQSRAFNAFQGILRGIDIAAMADDQRPVHHLVLQSAAVAPVLGEGVGGLGLEKGGGFRHLVQSFLWMVAPL